MFSPIVIALCTALPLQISNGGTRPSVSFIMPKSGKPLPQQVSIGGTRPCAVYEKYDRIPDRSSLSLNLGLVKPTQNDILRTQNDFLNLSVVAEYEGKRRPESMATRLIFTCGNSRWDSVRSKEVFLLADGRRYQTTTPSYSIKSVSNLTLETITASMSYDIVSHLATSKSIEGKIGDTEFALSDVQRSALTEFAKCLRDPDYDPNEKRIEAELKEVEAKNLQIEMALEAKRKQAEADRLEALKLKAEEFEREFAIAKAADDLLKQARDLDQRSKMVAAMKIYQQIISQYPGTKAAKSAADRLRGYAETKAKRKR